MLFEISNMFMEREKEKKYSNQLVFGEFLQRFMYFCGWI